MTIKGYAIGALLAVAIAAGFGWYRTEIARAKARGRLEVLTVQIEQRTRDFQAFRDSVAQRDSVRSVKMMRLADRADSLDAALVIQRRLAHLSKTKLDSLLADLPDSVSSAVAATVARYEREADTCSLAYSNCRERLGVETERAMDYRLQLIQADSLMFAQKKVIADLQNIGQPNTTLPWIVAAAAVALAGAVIVF